MITCAAVSIPAAHRLITNLPDLVVSLNRDGTILDHGGGRAVPLLALGEPCVGKNVDSVWPQSVVAVVMHLVRKAIASRLTQEDKFSDADLCYRARVTPEGPGRALCVVSLDSSVLHASGLDDTSGDSLAWHFDRRGFLKQFEEALSRSILTERPLAVIVIHLNGVEKIADIDAKAAELAVTSVLRQLSQQSSSNFLALCCCSGQLSDSQVAFVVQTADRQSIETCIADVSRSIRKPIQIGALIVELSPYSGVAMLGRDATSTKGLLDNARIAAGEARGAGSIRARFFSDTMTLKSLSRLDVGRELRSAIDTNGIRTRHVGRYDLATGRLVASIAYVRWTHLLRGAISPRHFLGVAETTGLAVALSRRLLTAVGDDYRRTNESLGRDVRFSYGPLRQHLLNEDFFVDIEKFLAVGAIPANRLEIRIPESTFVVLSSSLCGQLSEVGVQVVVDEVGRGMGSLDKLARSSVWGMQLDRAWVEALLTDEVALRVCRAGIASAAALGMFPIATGVDNVQQREALLKIGCRYGSGDMFALEDIEDCQVVG